MLVLYSYVFCYLLFIDKHLVLVFTLALYTLHIEKKIQRTFKKSAYKTCFLIKTAKFGVLKYVKR